MVWWSFLLIIAVLLHQVATGVILLVTVFLVTYTFHCNWVTSEAYSSPSIVLSARAGDGGRIIFDDFREAYYWLRHNTPEVSEWRCTRNEEIKAKWYSTFIMICSSDSSVNLSWVHFGVKISLTTVGNPILKIRCPIDCLISSMELLKLVKYVICNVVIYNLSNRSLHQGGVL